MTSVNVSICRYVYTCICIVHMRLYSAMLQCPILIHICLFVCICVCVSVYICLQYRVVLMLALAPRGEVYLEPVEQTL